MVLLDTTFLIDIERGKSNAFQCIQRFRDTDEILSTTIITLAELYAGAFYCNSNKMMKFVKQITKIMPVHTIDSNSAKKFGEIYSRLKNDGKLIESRDIFQASIAIAVNDPKIVTRDKKHLGRISEITVITY